MEEIIDFGWFDNPEVVALIKDLGLVPSDSLEAEQHLYSLRVWRSYQAEIEEKQRDTVRFQQLFFERFRKYARVDHKESQVDCLELTLF